MARNRTKMSGVLFQRLTEHAAQAGEPVINPEAGRWIARKDQADADLMAEAAAEARIVTRQIRLVRVEHEGERYFCTFGLPDADVVPPDLEIIDSTPGLFAIAVLEAQVRPLLSVSAAEIKQVLDDRFKDNAGYDGHDLAEIEPLFPKMVVYHAVADADYHAITDRVLGSVLVRTYFDGPISFETDTVEVLTRLFEADSARIPFRNLVQGVLSISWENLFLEAYRCVEQLYGMKRFSALKAQLNFAASPRDLAKMLEEQLSWRPKEAEAFIALVNLCDDGLVSTICAGMGIEAETHEKRCSKMVEQLYGLRNTIVHYRPAHEFIQKADADWNFIIRGMLEIVAQLYNEHAGDFFGVAVAVA